MRILILSTMYPNSKIFLSGVFVHEQVKALINNGIEVVVFAPIPLLFGVMNHFSDKWKSYSKVPKFEIIDGAPVYHTKYIAIPNGLLKSYWSYPYFYFLKNIVIRLHKEKKFDIIHAHGTIPNDHAALLLAKHLKLPYVVTVHGETIYKFEKHPSRYKNSIVALENAQAVIGVSFVVIDRLKKITQNVKYLYKIFNGFNPDKTFAKEIYEGSHPENIKILFAATIYERKGCPFLLKAFKEIYTKFSNTTLTVAGGGPQLADMKKLSNSLGISDRVKFTGVISHVKMMQLMNECDIFILPSWDEAFGVVYLEAMSFKKPIIGIRGEGITDIIKDGVNGLLIKPKDVGSIIEKLSLLIESEDLRIRIGNAGYQSIKQLTWENSASEVLKVYKKVLNERNIDLLNK